MAQAIQLKKVEQSSGFCGPAALSSLLDFYGVRMSERVLGDLCGTTPEYGTEPGAMTEALKKLGFDAVSKERATLEELAGLVTHGTPVLVNWWSDYQKPADGHYSIVYKVTDKNIYMMDPELGDYRRMSKQRFDRQWYDYYLDGRKNEHWLLYIAK